MLRVLGMGVPERKITVGASDSIPQARLPLRTRSSDPMPRAVALCGVFGEGRGGKVGVVELSHRWEVFSSFLNPQFRSQEFFWQRLPDQTAAELPS